MKISIGIKFNPQDFWIGVFWSRTRLFGLILVVCLLPCLPITIKLQTSPEHPRPPTPRPSSGKHQPWLN